MLSLDFYMDEKDKELGQARLSQGRRPERWVGWGRIVFVFGTMQNTYQRMQACFSLDILGIAGHFL